MSSLLTLAWTVDAAFRSWERYWTLCCLISSGLRSEDEDEDGDEDEDADDMSRC